MEKISFSLIGVGSIGVVHAWAARSVLHSFDDMDLDKINLRGVYNRTVSKAEWAKKRFGFQYYTGDWREILKDSETNAVSITLPNNMHLELVKEFSQAGKHILCEKPLGVNLDEAVKMYEMVKDSGIVNAVALVLRFMPSVAFAKKYIDEGKLGDVYHFRAIVAHSRYVNPDLKIEWRMKKSISGGGALADIGIHLIDLGRYLLGDISELVADTRTFIRERKTADGKVDIVDVDDAALLIMRFKNGVMGSLEATRFGPGFQELDRIEIHGSNGMIRFYLENPFEVYVYSKEEENPGVKRVILKPWQNSIWPPSKSIEGWGFLFVVLMHDFFKGILEGKSVKPDFYDGLKAQEVVEAAYQSAVERKWVELPLVNV